MNNHDRIYDSAANECALQRVPMSAKYVLDIGCGAGALAKALAKSGKVVDGVTFSEHEAAMAREHCENVYVHNLESGLPAEIERKYDAVVCSHVLEHVAFPERLLNDIKHSLNSQGILIVVLPNIMWWKSRIDLLAGRFEYTQGGLMDDTHLRWYTYRTAKSLLVKYGYKVNESSVNGQLPIWKMRNFLPTTLCKWVDHIGCRVAPGLFGYQLLYVASV